MTATATATSSTDAALLTGVEVNTSDNTSQYGAETWTRGHRLHVADATFDKDLRVIFLAVELALGLIGGVLVCLWLLFSRRRKSRVNTLILNVVMSDLLVIIGACAIQLVWEVMERVWIAGHAMCLIVKFFQSFSMMASSNMLVVLSIDRHQAIRSPLRDPLAAWKMTSIGWAIAALLSIPMFFLFRENFISNPESPFYGKTVCESLFRERSIEERQAFLTFISLVHFFIPMVIILVCYLRIFLKVSRKANESNSSKKHTSKPGKIQLQTTASNCLSKAKIKTLKMTIVIVLAFLLCGLPYHVLEMFMSYGDHTKIPAWVASVLGSLAVANSAANPYIFLLFNRSCDCQWPGSRGRGSPYDSMSGSRLGDYSVHSTAFTSTRTAVKYSPSTTTKVEVNNPVSPPPRPSIYKETTP